MKIAGIGSRDLDEEQRDICFRLGRVIAERGGEVHSGNAEGADQAFANGANSVDPKWVHLHLPWPNFNREAIVRGNVIHLPHPQSHYDVTAAKYHPNWQYLKQGAKKLHTRNVSIIVHPAPKDMVLAYPSLKLGGGGTGQGMRIAEGMGVPLWNLREVEQSEDSNSLLAHIIHLIFEMS